MASEKTISASGREFNSKTLQEDLIWVKKLRWKKSKWKTQDALVDKKSGTIRLYTDQNFDINSFELVEKGWTHDHCDICSRDIREFDNCAVSDAQIICEYCFEDFIK